MLFQKRFYYQRTLLNKNICVLICSTTFVRNIFILGRTGFFLRSSCPIKIKPELLKHTEKQYFTKIRTRGAEVLHADRRMNRNTDMKKPIFPFRNFADTPNKSFLFNENRVLPRV
jgi:hypothetical protein